MKKFFFLLFCPLLPFAQQPPPEEEVTPELIQEQLSEAEAKYRKAKDMFNPWYTGPLITPGATMTAPGHGNTQGYLSFECAYASFNKDRKAVSLPHNIYTMQVPASVGTGLTDSVDFSVSLKGTARWQNGHGGGGLNDLNASMGFLINPETLYVPGMRFSIQEVFPTGKYKNLSHNGLNLNATGGGSFKTTFGFAIAKVIWWTYPHPMRLRYFVSYALPTTVHVEGFNTYGGGFGTNGTVRPGNVLTNDFGMEVTLTQRWVVAMDIAYEAKNRTKFHGNPGTLASGAAATVGGGYADSLSLSPAVEYNFSPNFGLIGGVHFAVYGRNSPVFVTGQFNVSYSW